MDKLGKEYTENFIVNIPKSYGDQIGRIDCIIQPKLLWNWITANFVPLDKPVKAEIAEWISVKDRLPETSSELLLHTKSGSNYVGFYKYIIKMFICYGVYKKEIDDIEVTHWMPLPKPPEQ